jgi:hypothetical protein
MILKIETETGYKIWDNIDHIEVKEGCIFLGIDLAYDGADGRKLVDYQYGTDKLRIHCNDVIFINNKKSNPNCTILKAFRDKEYSSVTIAFDTSGYLTNDNGKTIERL